MSALGTFFKLSSASLFAGYLSRIIPGVNDEIDEGVEFTIGKMKGVYVVYGQVQEHMQLNTNMVDFVRFYAVKRSD